jgi:hypothetical protein
MRSLLRNHGISIPLFVLCVLCLIVQSITGYFNFNQGQQQHHQSLISYPAYLVSGDYWETVGENFEGEFISLSVYVLLTGFFVEKGAKESRKPGQKDLPDADQERLAILEARAGKHVPRAELMREPIRWLYQYSLFFAFLLLFAGSVGIHMVAGLPSYNSTLAEHGQPSVSLLGYLRSPFFWLQSVRNWQAGFLSTGLIAAFSIVFRERGSPASKGLDQPNEDTGESEG